MEIFFSNIINYLGIYGPILACFLIIIESIIPILPLCVFITINFITFGQVYGFIISWVCTLIGCNLAYYISKKFQNRITNQEILKIMNKISHMNVSTLTLITAIPFTPAFAINICCALSKMPYKNYLVSMFIGKIVMVYFWGFVGLTFIECLKEPLSLIKLAILLLIAYIVSFIVKKILKLEEK